jgi:hypothetical protein
MESFSLNVHKTLNIWYFKLKVNLPFPQLSSKATALVATPWSLAETGL